MKRYLFLFLLSLTCSAQQLVEHNWPDTTTSGGSVNHLYRFCDASGNITDSGAVIPGVTPAPLIPYGSVLTYSQPGYDPTTPSSNCSVFMGGTTSGFAAASSTTADFNWNQQFSIEAQTGAYLGATGLFTKNTGGSSILNNIFANTNGYACELLDFGGNTIVTCGVSGTTNSLAAGGAQAAYLNTANIPTLEHGRNYDIVFVHPGDGIPGHDQVWINGQFIAWSTTQTTNTGGLGGLLSVTVTAPGTGYANSFTPVFSGGGANCTYPTPTATASGGAITGVTLSGQTFGCVGTVTISFAAGGGTGGTGTVAINPATLSNSATFSVGDTYGGNFPEQLSGLQITTHALTATEIQQRFASTDYYRGVLPAKPATPQLVTYDNDLCADIDSGVSLVLLTRLQQMGYVTLLLDIDSENGSDALYGPQINGLYLARSGMFQVPIGINNTGGGATTCLGPVQGITTSPLNTRANYPGSTTEYRTILANAASSSIVMLFAASTKSLAELNSSPADGISALTGKQLIAAKVSAIYQMGGRYPTSIGFAPESNFADDPGDTAAEFDLTSGLPFSTVPLELYGFELGASVITPPGTLNIYPPTAAIYQSWCWFLGSNTSCLPTPNGDTRQSWDSMPIISLVAPSLYTNSGSGTVTINAVTGDDTWASSPTSNQFYHSAVSAFTLQSLISSILWSDPAFHSLR